MKTTVEIEDRLLREVKKAAAEGSRTLRELIESGLRRELACMPRQPRPRTHGSGSWPKGLDISSREKMWEWIESERDEGAR
ncbi:MAG: hypothetical protein ACRD1Y_04225 [Terriglobales bacterium]